MKRILPMASPTRSEPASPGSPGSRSLVARAPSNTKVLRKRRNKLARSWESTSYSEVRLAFGKATTAQVHVRVRPQLTKASDATQQWAEVYDGDLTVPFQLETDIAEKVVEALDISLLEAERRTIEERPTDNLEAYQYYLRGKDHWSRQESEEPLRMAVRMHEKAVALDPDFALAHAQLSQAHSLMYWLFLTGPPIGFSEPKKPWTRHSSSSPISPRHISLSVITTTGGIWINENALAQFRLAQKTPAEQ